MELDISLAGSCRLSRRPWERALQSPARSRGRQKDRRGLALTSSCYKFTLRFEPGEVLTHTSGEAMTSRSSASRDGDPADWSGQVFAKILARLDAHYPISDGYEEAHLPGPHWWGSQREHVVRWLRDIGGAGAYNRKTRGLGAQHFYQHFQCAPGLLWVGEALGESPLVVQRAADAAGGVGRPAMQCAAIRRVIPWSRIAELVSLQERRTRRP